MTIDLNDDRTAFPVVLMSLQTTLGIAKTGTKSLRVTVPEGAVAYLGLNSGDKLDWRLEIEDGKKVLLVKKAETESSETIKLASKYAKVRK